jgi:hypothetical protein
MMMIFDYAFYSLYNLYLEKEKKGTNYIANTTLGIVGLQLFLFLGIAIFNISFTPKDFSIFNNLGVSDYVGKGVFVTFWFLWIMISYKSYKKRLPEIVNKYRNHPRNKWFRPWMLYFVALGFVLIPILIVKLIKAFF